MRPLDIEEGWPLISRRAEPWLDGVPGGAQRLLQEIDDGRTILWASEDGVVGLSLLPSEDGKLDLFCRLAVSFSASRSAVSDHLPFLEKIARDLKASRIRFRSARRGWERALASRWHVAHVEYVTEVEP
jgi:hypothetical protein